LPSRLTWSPVNISSISENLYVVGRPSTPDVNEVRLATWSKSENYLIFKKNLATGMPHTPIFKRIFPSVIPVLQMYSSRFLRTIPVLVLQLCSLTSKCSPSDCLVSHTIHTLLLRTPTPSSQFSSIPMPMLPVTPCPLLFQKHKDEIAPQPSFGLDRGILHLGFLRLDEVTTLC
jgi:hypothetical protein